MKSLLGMILPLLVEASMLRMAVATECSSPLGMESRSIADNRLSASSSYNDDWRPKSARLNNNRSWSPDNNNRSEWLQIDLLERKVVSGIQTQGFQSPWSLRRYYVTSFKLSYSADATTWSIFQENGSDKIFVGNSNVYDVKENDIDPPIRARFIRLMAETWSTYITIRLELLGCEIQGAIIGGVGVVILIIVIIVSMFCIFDGNSNANGIKENNIDPPIRARFIRLMAETWRYDITVRLELLGCEIQGTKLWNELRELWTIG
ncbi:venom prothrombin activator oscutarin-C non-catalytic subunit-like [Branchiostoma floridae]|uniref:Venom prothrombin activator oscutarin-C non-catalytic subunit-like n=1 Tax=Branchiostoma floridae TaxID=7739 RepID=A0A9J7LI47_BRAFL|nr:venom prothrombin activator oscutarin-C non-catalytic subunit-like [Branchiostoma floridae]